MLLFVVTLIASVGISIVATELIYPEVDVPFRIYFLTVPVQLMFLYMYLAIRRRKERFVQLVTAWAGADALLTALTVPITLLLVGLTTTDAGRAVGSLMQLWIIPVQGHNLARAADVHWFAGVTAALFLFIMLITMFAQIAPAN